MKALVLEGPKRLVYHNGLPDPRIEQPTDVIVAVHRAGICGSDLHPYLGRESTAAGTIPGHEFVGEVVAVGSRVARLQIGDQVFSPFTTSCGDCFYCRRGLSARCPRGQLFGYLPPEGTAESYESLQGAQAEFVRVPLADSTLLRLCPSLSPEEALLLGDNFTTGYFCAKSASIQPGDLVAVVGCGAVGLCAIVAARFFQAVEVVAIDPVASRRRRAHELGALPALPELAATCFCDLTSTKGRPGADVVLEAVGSPAAQELAFQLVRPGGTIVAIGVHTSEHFAFSPTAAYDKNLTYRAGRCPVRSLLEEVVPLVEAGKLNIPTASVVTHPSVPLREGPSAYRMFQERRDDCVKVLLDPTCTPS
ncbi:MAG TPA: alcohol dehydrogenase [Planctomycetaceae bacterium]|nr:alcohol dehydrogenase [Planctomycetaceae bacterium]